mmetsp:Transcript_8599/g.756  ORF Transcript_8599/g.756 Transcript_8599/m.756 type:complete len:106 (+) Transcript_8599:418-735(+)
MLKIPLYKKLLKEEEDKLEIIKEEDNTTTNTMKLITDLKEDITATIEEMMKIIEEEIMIKVVTEITIMTKDMYLKEKTKVIIEEDMMIEEETVITITTTTNEKKN